MLEPKGISELNKLVGQFEFTIAQYKGKGKSYDEIKIIEEDMGENK